MQKKIEILGCCLAWFAVITQFVLMLQNRQANIPETIIRFFSFFTILTNLLVGLFFMFKLIKPISVFNKKASLTAITAFIFIVGLVYQIALRSIWKPIGMQHLVDELLHSVIPLYVVIYWFIYAGNKKSNVRSLVYWLLYPLVYTLFVLARGSFSNHYPYPFFNIKNIGISQVLLNSLLILILIVGVMFILTRIENKILLKKTI